MKKSRSRGQEQALSYSHLLEVMDGAASLAMAIRQAEAALMEPALDPEERAILSSALEASRERYEHVLALLGSSGQEAVERSYEGGHALENDLTMQELQEAGRAAEEGSTTAEQEAVRAIDRVGRSLDLTARGLLEGFLSHSSPLLRAGAMKVLTLHWKLKEYTDRVSWSLASDEDVDCRRAAALCLGRLYEGTRDMVVGADLVTALGRVGEEEGVRWACYHALVVLDGGAPARSGPVGSFDEKDADQGLLARYRPSQTAESS